MRGISAAVNRAHAETKGVCVVLENVAGQGNSVGHSFEQLKFMIDLVDDKTRIGVCLDTCHLFAAGTILRMPLDFAQPYNMRLRVAHERPGQLW